MSCAAVFSSFLFFFAVYIVGCTSDSSERVTAPKPYFAKGAGGGGSDCECVAGDAVFLGTEVVSDGEICEVWKVCVPNTCEVPNELAIQGIELGKWEIQYHNCQPLCPPDSC